MAMLSTKSKIRFKLPPIKKGLRRGRISDISVKDAYYEQYSQFIDQTGFFDEIEKIDSWYCCIFYPDNPIDSYSTKSHTEFTFWKVKIEFDPFLTKIKSSHLKYRIS